MVMLKKTLKSPLDCKEIKPVHPKGNTRILIGRTDAEAEPLILWPPDVKNWLIWKDPDARKDWRREKGMTEDEMVRWHHWLNGHEFEQAPGDGEGQGSLVCCSPWGHKESDTTEWLNIVPHSPPWTPSKGCWSLAAAASPGSVCTEADGQCPWQAPICSWHLLLKCYGTWRYDLGVWGGRWLMIVLVPL